MHVQGIYISVLFIEILTQTFKP